MRLQPINPQFTVNGEAEILASYEVVREVTNGITLDSTKFPADSNGDKIIEKGMPAGELSNGKYRPYTGTTLASDAASTSTTITVTDASRLIVGDTITIDSESATIDSIDYDTNVITLTSGTASAHSTGDTVITNDGGANPTVILKHQYNVKDGDHIAAGYEVAKVIKERIPVTVDDTLKGKMAQIVFA